MSYVHEWRIKSLNKELWFLDRELFARREQNGAICIWRKSRRFERHEGVIDGVDLLATVPGDHLIFALTDDWTIHGKPVECGTLVILDRLRAMDTRNRDIASESIKSYEKRNQQSKRHVQNEAEAFWKDNRRAFAKSVDDVRTCNMNKKVDKRRLKGA